MRRSHLNFLGPFGHTFLDHGFPWPLLGCTFATCLTPMGSSLSPLLNRLTKCSPNIACDLGFLLPLLCFPTLTPTSNAPRTMLPAAELPRSCRRAAGELPASCRRPVFRPAPASPASPASAPASPASPASAGWPSQLAGASQPEPASQSHAARAAGQPEPATQPASSARQPAPPASQPPRAC